MTNHSDWGDELNTARPGANVIKQDNVVNPNPTYLGLIDRCNILPFHSNIQGNIAL